MTSRREIRQSLNSEIAHAAQVTNTALSSFSRAAASATEAVAGGVGAFLGLGGMTAIGIAYPICASFILDICAFGGLGLSSVLIARLFTSRGRRAREDLRRSEMAFRNSELELQLLALERLPSWVKPDTKDAFVKELLDTVAFRAERHLSPPAHALPVDHHKNLGAQSSSKEIGFK